MARLRIGEGWRDFAVVFMDCDGVIFDVNPVKLAAFDGAVAEYPEKARRELLAEHKRRGGVSRYEKLRWFFTELCPVEDVEAAVAKAAERFAAISRAGYVAERLRPEALEFAARMGGADSVFVVSGADERELRGVFEEFDLTRRFAGVLGSRPDEASGKRDHFRRVLDERGLEPRDALMVGDGGGDYEAARSLGMPFVFLGEMSEWPSADSILAGAPNVVMADTWRDLLALSA